MAPTHNWKRITTHEAARRQAASLQVAWHGVQALGLLHHLSASYRWRGRSCRPPEMAASVPLVALLDALCRTSKAKASAREEILWSAVEMGSLGCVLSCCGLGRQLEGWKSTSSCGSCSSASIFMWGGLAISWLAGPGWVSGLPLLPPAGRPSIAACSRFGSDPDIAPVLWSGRASSSVLPPRLKQCGSLSDQFSESSQVRETF